MATKLDPELQKKYEQIMKTPTPSQAASTTSKAGPTISTPSPYKHPESSKPLPTEGKTPPSEPFLSSMPIQPPQNLGMKSFTFTGKKKIVQRDTPPPQQNQQPQKAPETKDPEVKKKGSPLLMILVILGIVAAWGLFWAVIFDFV